MGNADSTMDQSAGSAGLTEEQLATSETLGYRVLGVQPDSPASSAGLVSFLDFLVGCEGDLLLSNDDDVGDVDFVQLLKNSIGKELELLVYNIKSRRTRLVFMTPKADWGGKGLIGVTIRLDDYAIAEDRLIRVLDIEESSPADIAGLHPETDYLLGTSTLSFGSPAVLGQVLRQYENTPLELYVYNTESDMVRVVTLLPTSDWGHDGDQEGEEEDHNDYGDRGLLGAEVGMGYLHKFPEACRETDGSSVELHVVRAILPQQQIQEIADLTADHNLTPHAYQQQDLQPVAETAEGETPQSQQQQLSATTTGVYESSYPRPPPAPATGEMNAMESGERQQLMSAMTAASSVQPQLIPVEEAVNMNVDQPAETGSAVGSPPVEAVATPEAGDKATARVPSPPGTTEKPLDLTETSIKTTTAPKTGTVIATTTAPAVAVAAEDTTPELPVTSTSDVQSVAQTPVEQVAPPSQAEGPKAEAAVDDATADDATAGNISLTTVESESLTPVAAEAAAVAAEHGVSNESNKVHPGLEYEEEGEEEFDDDEEEYTDDDEDDYEDEAAPAASSFFGLSKYMPFGRSGGTFTPPVSNGAPSLPAASTSAASADFGMPPPPLSTNK